MSDEWRRTAKRAGAASRRLLVAMGATTAILAGCSNEKPPEEPPRNPPRSILLVTLDTTRADSIGPGAPVSTPAFNNLARTGIVFESAWTTVPQTLPSHTSILTGLYPAGHRIHENARRVGEDVPLIQEELRKNGYHTGAFVSGVPLARKFGLDRGFDVYDDAFPGGAAERSGHATVTAAAAWLATRPAGPVFLWVHFFEPHYPYEGDPGAPTPYLGEIVTMDRAIAEIVAAFRRRPGDGAIIVVGDHGEGLGDHGEAQHGALAYRSTMQVPLLIVVPGRKPAVIGRPVSTRRVFHTIRELAGEGDEGSLLFETNDVVLGEAMQPFLDYGWKPQVTAVWEGHQAIFAGRLEVYDLATDPNETRDLGADAGVPRPVRTALSEYPLPSPDSSESVALTSEETKQLASLGYVTGSPRPVIREDAPRPVEMTDLFDDLDRASGAFVEQRWAEAIPILRRIIDRDPTNLMSVLRLAAAYSATGRDSDAIEAFRRAREIAPESSDVDHYEGLHYARKGDWERAVPLLERALTESPGRVAAILALARQRTAEGRVREALELWEKADSIEPLGPDQLRVVGSLAMQTGDTQRAIESFERAKELLGDRFTNDLELGVLYLEKRRFDEARAALDRALAREPDDPMALFKRAQVSVLLREPAASQWIERAKLAADSTTGPLIERERLFR